LSRFLPLPAPAAKHGIYVKNWKAVCQLRGKGAGDFAPAGATKGRRPLESRRLCKGGRNFFLRFARADMVPKWRGVRLSLKDEFNREFQPLLEDAPLPERLAGTYRPETCLARREAGEVWLLRDGTGDRFILKTAWDKRRDLSEEFALLDQLSQELSVPRPVEYFEEDGVQYLLRDYLPGQSLAEAWECHISPRRCVEVGTALCRLLEWLHGRNPPIIHRDIKPENIVLSPEGKPGLIDFGIARAYKEGRTSDTTFVSLNDCRGMDYAP